MNNSPMGIPVISIELKQAQLTLHTVLNEALLVRDEEIRKAIETALSPENIQKWLADSVRTEIRNAIDAEVQHFYRYGEGRKALREAIERRLASEDPCM